MFILFTLLTTLYAQQLYCEVNKVISLTTLTQDECIQNGWEVKTDSNTNEFIFKSTETKLTIEISEEKKHTFTIGTDESESTLTSLSVTNKVSTKETQMNIHNVKDISITVDGEVTETTSIFTKGKNGTIDVTFKNGANEEGKKNKVVLKRETSHGKYLKINGNVEITLDISAEEVKKIEGTCEAYFVANKDVQINENGEKIKAQNICTFSDGNARFGICAENVTENCECFHENQQMNYDDCWYHGNDLDLTVSGVLVLWKDASFKSVKFVEEFGRIVVHNKAQLTVGTFTVPERYLLFGNMKVEEIILANAGTIIEAPSMKVNKVTQLHPNEVFFVGKMTETPKGLKKACEGKFNNGYSRYVAETSKLECECHAKDGEPVEEDCILHKRSPMSPYSLIVDGIYDSADYSYWKSITATNDSMIVYGNVYAEKCEFDGMITIGGRVECKELSGKTVEVHPFTNLPIEDGLENVFVVGNTKVDTLITNVKTEVIGEVKNIYSNAELIVSGEQVVLDKVSNVVNITVAETAVRLTLKNIEIPKETTQYLIVEESDVELFLSVKKVTGNAIIVEQKYRPVTIIDGEFTCNQRYLLCENMTCETLLPERIECIASADDTYKDEEGNQIYYCPCDNSTECAHVISQEYSGEVFTVEYVPTYFVVQTSVNVVVDNKKMDVMSLSRTREVPSMFVDGVNNTFTILEQSGAFEIGMKIEGRNEIIAQKGVLKTYYMNDTLAVVYETSEHGCAEFSTIEHCTKCIGKSELVEGECILDESVIPPEPSANPVIPEETSSVEDSNDDDEEMSTAMLAGIIAIVVLGVILILVVTLLVVLILVKKLGCCKKEATYQTF